MGRLGWTLGYIHTSVSQSVNYHEHELGWLVGLVGCLGLGRDGMEGNGHGHGHGHGHGILVRMP